MPRARTNYVRAPGVEDIYGFNSHKMLFSLELDHCIITGDAMITNGN